MIKWRKDSVKELRTKKTQAQLQEENVQLRAKVEALEEQIEEQADALIELAGLLSVEEV